MEKSLTIGVAGHAGHGKTSLVRHLVGVLPKAEAWPTISETRLEASTETKFYPLTLPSGLQGSLVDAPGNPAYLKNLVRGLCCVDMAVLVIAADDGVMPQTREHLEILGLSGVKHGLIVISRTDLVDDETVSLAALEALELTENTFLAGVPVLHCSEKSIACITQILEALDKQAQILPARSIHAAFRLSIDQVNQFSGFGTVVTGTVLAGSIRKNDTVLLLPDGRTARARNLQTHGRDADIAYAGRRVGINLHKVPFNSLKKGMVVASPDAMAPSRFLNAEMKILDKESVVLQDRIRIRLFTGTAVTGVMIVLMERKKLSAGETELVQIRPVSPLSACPGDRFLVSLLNENRIIGGGRILETTNVKYRDVWARMTVPRLAVMQCNDLSGFVDVMLDHYPYRAFSSNEIACHTIFSSADTEKVIRRRVSAGELIVFGKTKIIKKKHYEQLTGRVIKVLEKLAGNKLLKLNFHIKEISENLEETVSHEILLDVLEKLCSSGQVVSANGLYQLPVHRVHLGGVHQATLSKLLEFASASWPKPFTAGHFCKVHGSRFNKKTVEKILRHLASQDALVSIDQERFMEPAAIGEIKRRIKTAIEKKGQFSISDCQSVLGYGRTQAISVLEYLDDTGYTKRNGNVRVLAIKDCEQ